MNTNQQLPEMLITIRNKRATYDKAGGNIVCANTYTAVFDFDAEWNGYDVKKARFTFWHKGRYESIDVEFNGNTCPIPPLFNTKFVKVGVYVEGGISTTTPAIIECDESILCGVSKSVMRTDEINAINDALIIWLKQNPPKDGFSPTITVTEITNGHRVTITDINDSKSFDVMHGSKGDKGDRGEQGIQGIRGEKGETGEKGADGISPIIETSPTDNGHQITFTDASGTHTINLTNGAKGEQGERGLQGEKGAQGEKGEKGDTGAQGIQGEQGERGLQGEKGDTGAQGIQGERGLQGERGEQGIQGERGADGYTPVRGTDYWTPKDIESIRAYVDDVILGGEW